jgi:hypothetical protein
MNEELLENIAFMLYLDTWTVDDETVEDFDNETLKSLTDKWKKEWLPNRFDEHFGDCTKAPIACHRCIMDEIFNKAKNILTIKYEIQS